ncbi:sce7726 family protein [Rhodoplanes serenus]|uniref:sce7726 family protein n=1 Tax=Rhodoplanes serenus TaxID=200615 RepID=UPI0011B944C5|nr:sce7726 family protein [Rhodoplanes serenus]
MHDREVRFGLLTWLASLHAGDESTRVVEEMGIWANSVRIDVAVINGELQGFELKSARDTLDRLPRQIELYSQVFDRVTLVTEEKHLHKAADRIPEWWGMSVAMENSVGGATIVEVRPAALNQHVDRLQLSRLLWRSEALEALKCRGLAKGVLSKAADVLAHRLSEELPLDELKLVVRDALKCRQTLRQAIAN